MNPRILVVDDLFGRVVPGRTNPDRENICAHFLLRDVSNDLASNLSRQKVLKPTADAVFCRGQNPEMAGLGSVVENDLPGVVEIVRQGWQLPLSTGAAPWAMLLLDLCFYTGEVTAESHRRAAGMPEGRTGDDDPAGYFGLKLLDAIHREFPELPIFILSSKPREDVSLEFSRRGALGFIARDDPRGPDLLADALQQHGLVPDTGGEIVGNSLPLLLALREARRAASHRQNILIRGERGVGKELIASYIHRMRTENGSPRLPPFVAVNSAVLRTDLFSSELFGIEPKTASGVDGKIGLIETADGGELFLDEIADMPPAVQAAVLRTLQDRKITPVGARQPKAINVRFLSATNADLENDPREFRPDLLDRLRAGGTLRLPALREHKMDIPPLAEAFVREAEAQHPGALRREIEPGAMTLLLAHDWPGNVRELRGCLFEAVTRYSQIEHLVPGHLNITEKASSRSKPVREHATGSAGPAAQSNVSDPLSLLLVLQRETQFGQNDIAKWSGRLPELQHGQTWLLTRYLEAALQATKRRSADHPDGILQIHPAVKLMTGDASMTAVKAADVIKRILGPLEDELVGDLHEALAIAIRLRPRSPKRNGSKLT